MDDPPSVLVGSGPLDTGPFYLIIANVPEGTTWQHVKDFVKSQVDLKRLDMYVNLHGARMDSGWIRVIGYKAFRQIKRIFKQNYFRGQEVVVHDPGYRDGSASVLIRDPFYKDKDLFVTPNITGGVLSSMPPVPHPFPPSGPPPGFATYPMPTYAAAPRPFPPVVPTSHNWPVASPPPLPPPAMFYPPPPQHRLQQYTYQDPAMTWTSGIYHPLSTTGTPPSDSRRSSTSQEGGNYTSSSGSTPTYTHARPVHAEIPPRTVPRKFGSDTVLVVDGSAGREKVPFVYSA